MQYLLLKDTDTLQSVSKIVGSKNVDALLSENCLTRSPKIAKQWKDKCEEYLDTNPPEVTASRKAALLNRLTGSEDVFEKACLMDENEWKVFSAYQSFTDTLKIPETVTLPYSERVIGDTSSSRILLGGGSGVKTTSKLSSGVKTTSANNAASSLSRNATQVYLDGDAGGASLSKTSSANPVSTVTYKAVMTGLKTSSIIDPGVFSSVNSSPSSGVAQTSGSTRTTNANPISFGLPWGRIQLYSSLLDEVIDIPAYPEQVDTGRTATYTQMPDVIYQYEPWVVYQSSGPREQALEFHLHRDMWSGNHLDGQANELVRFCEANTFPRYSGSAVLSPTVKLYIDGKVFISGVLTSTRVNWQGPIGQDNWYLEFTLSLTIQEVSETPLNIDTVRQMGLIGG